MQNKQILKVQQFYNKNQFVIEDMKEDKTYFQSYNSLIAIRDKKNATLTLGKDWDYSKTTMKHLYLFLEEYCYFLFVNKIKYCKNKRAAIQKMIEKGEIVYDDKLI